MAKANKKQIKNTKTNEAAVIPTVKPNKNLNMITLIGLIILLFYAPFFRGLYFNEEMSTTFLYSGILFLIYVINRLINKDFRIFKSYLDIAALVLVLVYAVPILLGIAASAQGAWDKFLRYINYFFIYLMCRDIIKEDKNIRILLNAIIVSAIGVCILGIDAGAGSILTNKINWFIQQIPVWLHMNPGISSLMTFKFFGGFDQGRIFSTLQYPNVFASYLGAVFFLIAGLSMTSASYWKRLWYGAAGFIVFYTFILTGSRGMIVVLPLMVMILFISFWNKKLLVGFVIDAFVPVVTGVIFSALYGSSVNAGQYQKVWLTLLAGIVLSASLTSIIQKSKDMLFRINTRIYAATAAAIAVICIVLLGIALNIEKPLLLKHEGGEAASAKVVIRDITNLRSSAKYTIDFDIDARSNIKNDDSYRISVSGMDKFVNLEQLAEIRGKTEKGRKSLEFATKPEITTIRLQMENYTNNTSVSFSNFTIKEADTGKTRKLIVQYAYLPTDLVYKIQDINLKTHNAWERLVFVEDAFKIIGTYPMGTGGGGWRALYHKYQSYQYASNEVHNYPVQLWVETGILGIAALTALIILTITSYRTVRIKQKEPGTENTEALDRIAVSGVIFTSILSLYAHSVIDFDLSLSAMPIVLWALTGIISGIALPPVKNEELKLPSYASISSAGLVMVFMLMLIVSGLNSISGRYIIAGANAYEKSFSEKGILKQELVQVLPKLMPAYKKYLQLQPLDEKKRQIYIKYLNVYQTIVNDLPEEKLAELNDELKKNIETNVKNEPNSLDALSTAASFSIACGKLEEGLDYANKVADVGRFIPDAYSAKGQLYIMAGEAAYKSDNKEKAKEYLNKAAGIKKEFEKAAKQSLKPLPVDAELDKVVIQAQQKLAQLGGA